MSLKTAYLDLAADIKKHILQEYTTADWIESDAETHRYFRQYALQQKAPETKKTSSAPVSTASKPISRPLSAAPKPVLKNPEPQKNTSKPVEEKPQEKEQKNQFQLQPFPTPSHIDLSDFRRILQEIAPSYPIIDKIPSDAPEVAILTSETTHAFIVQLAHAIDRLLAPTTIVQVLPANSAFKFVIATHATEQAHLIIDPHVYTKDPTQKARLWEDIKQHYAAKV